ncbi:hypothetical protein Y032_0011g1556 [Ancylostoma ceylanicum]|uniref:Uncharacterized protein n=1 Tax=Ancylostoma ceylanicum TaxID=53326 RepID=A0A016VEQ8_9BILA|nr:hypothetical protein Y032_0011g1556 [Ancylostoma ceylanicum]
MATQLFSYDPNTSDRHTAATQSSRKAAAWRHNWRNATWPPHSSLVTGLRRGCVPISATADVWIVVTMRICEALRYSRWSTKPSASSPSGDQRVCAGDPSDADSMTMWCDA